VIEIGTLVQVLNPAQGSSLTVDVAAGAEVLPVASLSDFYEDGGILQAGDNTYPYSGYDITAKTLLLDDPLTVGLSEGDEILSLNALGRPESPWIAEILIDEDDEEPVEADIPTGMRGFFPPGTAAAGALVDVESTPTGYRVASRPMDPDEFDGTKTHVPFLRGAKGTNQPLPHLAWTTLTGWFLLHRDRLTHSLSPERFIFEVDGTYDIRVGVTITAGGPTSNRAVRMRLWDAAGNDLGPSRMVKVPSDGSTAVETAQYHNVVAGMAVSFEAQQQSGVDLEIAGSNVFTSLTYTDCAIRWVGP
jgi:hypothetical protein